MTNLYGIEIQSIADLSQIEKLEEKLSAFVPPLPSFLIICLGSISLAILPSFEMIDGAEINPKSPLAHCVSASSKRSLTPKSYPVKKTTGSKDQV
jgi:hypothetical protein